MISQAAESITAATASICFIGRLTAIDPSIGAKTAAKIVAEIKLEGTQATGGRDIGPIVDALSSLGVDRVRARDAVVAMVEADPDVDEPTILETVLSTTGAA